MNGVGVEILARIPVPQLSLSYPQAIAHVTTTDQWKCKKNILTSFDKAADNKTCTISVLHHSVCHYLPGLHIYLYFGTLSQ